MFIKIKLFIEKILSFNIGNIFKMDINNKISDSIKDSNFIEYNKSNTNNIIQQNFNIAILPDLNVSDEIKYAISLGNKNAQLTGYELQKLLKDNNIPLEQLQAKLSDPDYLYVIAKANKIAYFTNDIEKRRVLSNLIYDKFTSEDDIDSNTLSNAITAMEALTNSHLKLNALLYIFRSGYLETFISIEDFLKFYNNYIIKLINVPSNKIMDIGTAIIGNGCAIAYTFGSNLNEFFNKSLRKDIDNLLNQTNLSENALNQSNVIKNLNKFWHCTGLTSAFPTAVGKHLATIYLQNILNLNITF